MLIWRVFIHRNDKLEFYNIFNHYYFKERVAKILQQRIGRAQISEALKKIARYCFWSKCEYEVLVESWPPSKDFKSAVKIDVYEQLEMNWDALIDYIIKNKREIIQWYKRIQKEFV
jgi:hypothetical protein